MSHDPKHTPEAARRLSKRQLAMLLKRAGRQRGIDAEAVGLQQFLRQDSIRPFDAIARLDSAVSNSLIAAGRMGAPRGSRKRFTRTKSHRRAGRHASRSNQ